MYFPRLYPDELLYSGIARCRVHIGMCSHKRLLSILFSDTKVAAITDLPTHLAAMTQNTALNPADLIAHHTMFPLYAPFIPEDRRKALLASMIASDIPGTLGLAGMTTALLKWPPMLRYCPLCLPEMVGTYGEFYWHRKWQAKGVDVCLKHQCAVLSSTVPFRRLARHEFIPASPRTCQKQDSSEISDEGINSIADRVCQLLEVEDMGSPNYYQWSCWYQQLATECGARRGKQVRVELMWDPVTQLHSKAWLASNNLLGQTMPPPWFFAIFRKHRKAFSYLQHLVVWSTLRPESSVGEILRKVRSLPVKPVEAANPHECRDNPAQGRANLYRKKWLMALSQVNGEGAKSARMAGGGQAIYAWLYRHDKDWLIATNRKRWRNLGNHSQVNWAARDRALVRQLIRIEATSSEDLSLPRKSRNWYLGQLPHHSSVESHLGSMPLCHAFLSRYAETIAEYQIRRLTRQMITDALSGTSQKRWQLERNCGLQKNRLTDLASDFLRRLEANG